MNADSFRSLVDTYERAVGRQSEALDQPQNPFLRDSAIQRFEFTFEFAWKVLKEFLSLQGLEARSSRAAIRGVFEVGLIPEDDRWLGLLELRNLASHTYDEILADRLYAEFPGALRLFRTLLLRIREELTTL